MAERLLAPHEAAIAAAGVRVVLWCDVEGELDEAVLAEALVHLRVRHPLLAGRITSGDGRARVRVDEDAAATPGHGADFDEEINAPLDWARDPLLRLTVLREHGTTRVVMTLPRAFVDGMSYLAVHRDLWDIHTALSTHRPVPDEVVRPALGPALDDLLAARFTPEALRDFVAERARLDAEEPPALLPAPAARDGGPGDEHSCRVVGVEVTADHCEKLVRRAHEASLSLNALVSGALLTSLRALFPAPGPLRLLCTTAVDMRRRLSPPLPAEVLQSAATTTSVRLLVNEYADPVCVGRDLDVRLRADLESGAAAMELAAFPHMLDQHPPSLVITNVGAVPEPATPPGLRISDVHLAPLGHLPMIFAMVSRHRGRLAIGLTYSRAWYTDAQIRELADRVSAALGHLAEEQRP